MQKTFEKEIQYYSGRLSKKTILVQGFYDEKKSGPLISLNSSWAIFSVINLLNSGSYALLVELSDNIIISAFRAEKSLITN